MISADNYEYPLAGWTGVTMFVAEATGEADGHASGVRYLAQIDDVIVSAEVTGPFVDFNFDAAFWVLEQQANCVQQDTPCAPTTMPMGKTDWLFVGDALHFAGYDSGEGAEARWVYPVSEPVRAPEMTATNPQ